MQQVYGVLRDAHSMPKDVEKALALVKGVASTSTQLSHQDRVSFLRFLLQDFAVDWAECLSEESRGSLVDGLFFGPDALLSVIDTLKTLLAQSAHLSVSSEEQKRSMEEAMSLNTVAEQQRQLIGRSPSSITDIRITDGKTGAKALEDAAEMQEKRREKDGRQHMRLLLRQRTDELVRMLHMFLDSSVFVSELLRDLTACQTARSLDAAISLVVSVPARMANLSMGEVDEAFLPRAFSLTLLHHVGASLPSLDVKEGGTVVASLLVKLSRSLGQADAVGCSLAMWLQRPECHTAATAVVTALPETGFDVIFCHLLSCIKADVYPAPSEAAVSSGSMTSAASSTISRILAAKSGEEVAHARASWRRWVQVMTGKLLVHSPLPSLSMAALVAALLRWDLACDDQKGLLFVRALKDMSSMLCSRSFLENASSSAHESVSRSVILCLQLIAGLDGSDREKMVAAAGLPMSLIPAVQLHIGCPNMERRRWGFVRDEAAHYLPVAGADIVTDDCAEEAKQVEEERQQLAERMAELTLSEGRPEGIDREGGDAGDVAGVEEIEESDGAKEKEEEDEEEWDSDDDFFQPYDMNDDEADLREVQLPLYIRDCLKLLRDSEKADSIDAALTAAESIVRKEPSDLHETAVELGVTLLYLQDTFELDGYADRRYGALAALAVTCTEQVVGMLTKEFYGNNHTIGHRVDILQVLMMAAKEISESSSRERESSKKVAYADSMVVDGGSKTRRWSDTKRNKPKARRNAFEPLAGLFFFPLVGRFDSRKNTFNLLGEDSVVLGQLLFCCGTVMECCSGTTAVSQRIGAALLELSLALRTHSEPYVRKAVIFAVSRVFRRLSGAALMSDVPALASRSKSWLERVMQDDADQLCRELAFSALVCLRESLDAAQSPSPFP